MRQPHVISDIASRSEKAKKIHFLLSGETSLKGARALDFGCGAGVIASYFGDEDGPNCDVDAVDVQDLRSVTTNYRFLLTGPEKPLPWGDGEFDIIISNHVLEHVGEGREQLSYLRELRRLLSASGVGYIALPNRWMLIEPHYRLAFLSWLPRKLRNPWLRLFRKGDVYDCRPLSKGELELILDAAGLSYENVCFRALLSMGAIEGRFAVLSRIAAVLPDIVKDALLPFFPTLCYLIRRKETS